MRYIHLLPQHASNTPLANQKCANRYLKKLHYQGSPNTVPLPLTLIPYSEHYSYSYPLPSRTSPACRRTGQRSLSLRRCSSFPTSGANTTRSLSSSTPASLALPPEVGAGRFTTIKQPKNSPRNGSGGPEAARGGKTVPETVRGTGRREGWRGATWKEAISDRGRVRVNRAALAVEKKKAL